MGGIVAKVFLLKHKNSLRKKISTDNLILISTPSWGNDFTNILKLFCPNPQVKDIQSLSGSFIDVFIDDWNREFAQSNGKNNFNIFAAYEMVPTSLPKTKFEWGNALKYLGTKVVAMFNPTGVKIVERRSATDSAQDNMGFMKDHITIAKPNNNQDLIYDQVKQWILEEQYTREDTQIKQKLKSFINEVLTLFKTKLENKAKVKTRDLLSRGEIYSALEIYKKSFPNDHIKFRNLSRDLNALGHAYEKRFHFNEAFKFYKSASLLTPKTWILKYHAGVMAFELGKYKLAMEYFNNSLDIKRKKIKKNFPDGRYELTDVLLELNYLGLSWHALAKYKKAVKEFTTALSLYGEPIYRKNHPDLYNLRNNLAVTYDALGEFLKAKRGFERIHLREKEYRSFIEIPILQSNQASHDLSLGQVKTAIHSYETALEYLVRDKRRNTPLFGQLKMKMGEAYLEDGDTKPSFDNFNDGINIIERFYGNDHPYFGEACNSLGKYWMEMGRYFEAEKYFQKALKIFKNRFNSDHPSISNTFTNLGVVNQKLWKMDRAENYFKKALSMDLIVFGKIHPAIAADKNNLGSIFFLKGEIESAIENFNEARMINFNIYGSNYPNLSNDLNSHGSILLRKGFKRQASSAFEEALEIEKFNSNDHKKALLKNNYANVLKSLGKVKEALKNFEESKILLEKKLGLKHPDLGIIYMNLAFFLEDIGEKKKAKKLFLAAKKIFENSHLHNLTKVADEFIQ